MIKYSFTVFITCFITGLAMGQAAIKGRVLEDKTRIPLADILVRNNTTDQYTATDEKGRFSISAKPGDILVFKGFNYLPDTLLLTDIHGKEVLLVPHLNVLNEVKVITDSTKNLNTYYDPLFHGQRVVFQRDANLNYKGGLVIRFWYWKKDERRREKLAQEVKEQGEQDEVNQVFRPLNIARYVPLKGVEMDNFLVLYTPGIKVYFSRDFDLPVYLSACYKKYLELPEDKKHPDKLAN